MSPLIAVGLVSLVTIALGAVGMRVSRTTSDFYVASRAVSPRWNASAIGGEYLSAASFLGVAGLVMAHGHVMLWYPVGYTAGYLVLVALIAAPLRRSGAYTLPDFADIRLRSRTVRRLAAVLVVGIGWLYLLPQFQGAGLALRTVTGAPGWVGTLIVAVVVVLNVAAGGMRSITFVQAFQYWLKLTAIAIPVFVLGAIWLRDGAPDPSAIAPLGGPDAHTWLSPFGPHAPGEHPLYRVYSLLLALFFGTMGLPHVLVRFYTNPDGRAARRTTLTVVGLLGLFYVFPPVYGALGRIYTPELYAQSRTDAVVLLLPGRMLGGTPGELLTALVTAGAFAAFLSTASGLTVSVAGVLSQDLLGRRRRSSIGAFRAASLVAVVIPALGSLIAVRTSLADTVGLAFAVAASTFCPLLVLGIWWRGLSSRGALAGLVVGGTAATAAAGVTIAGVIPTGPSSGLVGALLAQPAAWSMPLAFAVMVLVSLLRPDAVRDDRRVDRVMVLLHTPEGARLDRSATRRAAISRRADGDTAGVVGT